ncbi:DUF1648 domain-containing protein [Psychroserpens jangbogonensis]|uniref:DUF1648 domain-containing protein n=1 Tax=Psychroserpens jangbogonensis TaxID=1484460 RepID=UPI00053D7585|nr:DUF1648 domain-containing protein [Psychroserpens jangbogonensis]
MNTGRPKIKAPLEGLDIVLDIISATILILLIAYAIISYTELPDSIPSHFNAKGEVDGYSEKITIWLLPAIGVVLFFGLYIINRYPYLHNYMVNITEENALKNYRLSTRIVRFTNLFIMFIFGIITYSIVESAKGNNSNMDGWILPLIIGLSILFPIAILIYKKKINK